MLSDVVAVKVRALRDREDMTRADLAERCARLGWPQLTAPAIGNLETGRRGGDGQRRREVTVDELVVLALAFGISPLELLLGDEPEVEVTPGGLRVGRDEALAQLAGFVPQSMQIWALHEHRRLVQRLRKQMLALESIRSFAHAASLAAEERPDPASVTAAEAAAEAVAQQLAVHRRQMLTRHETLPPLPPDLRFVDEAEPQIPAFDVEVVDGDALVRQLGLGGSTGRSGSGDA